MGAPDNIYLILADTNGFDQDVVLAHGIQDINGASGRLGQSPEMTSCGQRPDKNALIHTVSLHSHTVPQDGSATERTGRINRKDAHSLVPFSQMGNHLVN